jgi:hypothetical protein
MPLHTARLTCYIYTCTHTHIHTHLHHARARAHTHMCSHGAAHSGANRDDGGTGCHDDGQGHAAPAQGYVHLSSAGCGLNPKPSRISSPQLSGVPSQTLNKSNNNNRLSPGLSLSLSLSLPERWMRRQEDETDTWRSVLKSKTSENFRWRLAWPLGHLL